MQYYYECLEVYEKLVPEVKKHCKLLRKLDAKFLVVRDRYFEALSEFEDKKEEMTPSIRQYSKQVIEKGQETLNRISQEKWKTANSLMITIEYYLSRINGYVREFKCEIDSDNTPGTSIEIEKKFLEANRKRVKEIQEIRDEYPFLDDIFKIPEPELESTESAINESMVEPIKINGHRQQNIAVLLQDIGSSFRDDPPGIRSSSNSNSNKKNSFKIKTERRGSINGGAGTPSPRAMSPRLPKTPRFPNNNDSTMLTLPEPSPSSNSVSPMEVSPGPHGNLSFSYSENNILQNSFSTMPSFSGSQESRHGRQRKYHSNNLSSTVTSAQPRSSRSRKKKKKEKKKLDQAEPQSSRSSRLQKKLDHENQVKLIHKEYYNQGGNPKYSLSLNKLHQRLEKENGQLSNIS